MAHLSTTNSTATNQKTQIYEGVLYKQGRRNKAWKERFFVLYSDRTLEYYKKEQDWDKGKGCINRIDLSITRSIAPVNKQAVKTKSPSQQLKTKKSRRGSLSRRWSIDFGAIFSNKGTNDDESDNEDDGVTFIELVLNQQFTFEIVQSKRTYNLCTDDPQKFNKWLQKLESTTFGKRIYKGWLLKQSERNKKWERRWFIIYDTKEMRYYDDATRSVSRGMAVLTQLKKITKMDDTKSQKKYKQINVLKLDFKQRTLLLSCTPSDDRRIWFDKLARVGGKHVQYIVPIYEDYLYRYNETKGIWKKFWFVLDKRGLIQFRDEGTCDEYTKHAYFDKSVHDKAYKRYVENRIRLMPFDPKCVQKIRPGSNLQKKLIKECIFIIHSKDIGKIFFATEQKNQLNRWFKKIRSLAGDEGRKKSKSAISVMTNSSFGDYTKANSNDPSLQINTGPTKNESKILKMLKELQAELNDCQKDIAYVKDCWEKNNEDDDDDDDAKTDDDDDDDDSDD